MHRHLLTVGASSLLFLSTTAPAQQAPPGALDAAWLNVCAQAAPGSDFFDRCQEIINAGPGSGDRRSAAAVGNNLGTTGAQGRAANGIDEARDDQSEGIDYEEEFGRFSVHFNSSFRNTERDASDFENGYDSDLFGINGGFDYRLGNNWSIGAVAGYQDGDTEFDLGAGGLETSAWSLAGVLNGTIGTEGWFSAYAGIASLDYESVRNIDYSIVLFADQPNQETREVSAVARGDTEGDQVLAGVAVGFSLNRGALNYGLSVSTDLVDTDIDGYSESGGGGLAQVFGDQDVRSLATALTANLSYTNSRDWGVLTPYARLRLEHEFDDDARTLNSRFAGDPTGFQVSYATEEPDRNYASAAVGLTGLYPGGTAWYLEAERLLLHEFLSEWAVNAGVRFEF